MTVMKHRPTNVLTISFCGWDFFDFAFGLNKLVKRGRRTFSRGSGTEVTSMGIVNVQTSAATGLRPLEEAIACRFPDPSVHPISLCLLYTVNALGIQEKGWGLGL